MSDDRPWNESRPGSTATPQDTADGSGWSIRRTAAVVTGVGGLLVVIAGILLLNFVTGIGCGCQPMTPQFATDWTYDDGSVQVTHDGGDSVTAEYSRYLEVTADGDPIGTVGLPFEAGDTARFEGVEPGQTVRVIWHSREEEDDASVLAVYEVPTARSPGQ